MLYEEYSYFMLKIFNNDLLPLLLKAIYNHHFVHRLRYFLFSHIFLLHSSVILFIYLRNEYRSNRIITCVMAVYSRKLIVLMAWIEIVSLSHILAMVDHLYIWLANVLESFDIGMIIFQFPRIWSISLVRWDDRVISFRRTVN